MYHLTLLSDAGLVEHGCGILNFVIRLIGTFGFAGFMPVAPATFASAGFLALYWFVPGGEALVHPLVVAFTLLVSVPISTYLEKRHGHDARCIVIDEIAGLQLILVWASPTFAGIVATFFLFRLFDIAKPFPIRRSQRLPAGYGIVIDDLLAAVYTRLAMVGIAVVLPAAGRFV